MAISYKIPVHQTRQDEAIRLAAHTFKDCPNIKVKKSTFSLGRLTMYITVSKNMEVIRINLDANPNLKSAGYILDLPTLADIKTIPLIHPAIQASQE